jgi:CRP-like cAMP-binding protein
MTANTKNRFLDLIPEATKKKMTDIGMIRICRRGEQIFGEREEQKSLYILLDGYAALYRSSRYGENRILMVCAAGDLLNESVIEGNRTPVAAESLSESRMLCVGREAFAAMLNGDFELMQAVCRSLSVKTSRLYHQLGNANGTYPLEKRLAARLLKLSREYGIDTRENGIDTRENGIDTREYGIDTEAGRRVGFRVTVSFLANLLGAKRETVSRYMSKLKKQGYIQHEDGILTVADPEGLRAILEKT